MTSVATRLGPRRGETLVVTFPNLLSDQEFDRVVAGFKAQMSHRKVLILEGGPTVQTIHAVRRSLGCASGSRLSVRKLAGARS